MRNKNLPENLKTVIVVFNTINPYGKRETLQRKGFYVEVTGVFSIPNSWTFFKGVEMPHGFGAKHLKPTHILSWRELT